MATADYPTLRPSGHGTTARKRRAVQVTALALIPWILLTLDDAWVFSPPGSIDPWLYHGFMRHYPEFIGSLFPSTYYGTRLGWLLPGFAAYAGLPPDAANVLLHVGLYYVAIAATYIALSQFTDDVAAFVGAAIVGTNATMLVALGWDYTDGAVIAYVLASTAAALHASLHPERHRCLLACGAALAAMVHSNLAAVLIVPAPVIAFLMRSAAPVRLRLAGLVTIATGALLATLAMGAANVAAGGSLAFFMPSIRWALSSGQPTHTIVRFSFPSVLRLLVPATALVAIIAAAVTRRLTRPEQVSAAMLAWVVVVMGLMDAMGAALLATQYYTSWLLPFACLALVMHVVPANGLRPRDACATVGILLVAGALGLRSTTPGVVPFGGETAWLPWPLWAALAGGLLTATAICAARRPAKRSMLTAWTMLLATATAIGAHSMTFRPDRDSRDLFDAVDQVLRIVRTREPARRPLFWYGESPLKHYFDSIASTHLFLYSIVGFEYPSLPDDIQQTGRNGATLIPPARVAVLSPEAVDAGAVRRAFARHGLDARIDSSHTIATDSFRFDLTLVAVTSGSSADQ